ncbi:MAG: DUF1538 domain-containing protein [Spirochaetia bacterium]|nr:DUF1538 domain-containing protein [Spirochaetia bacterium]
MNLLRKFKETSLSVAPIVFIVLFLHLTIAPLSWPQMIAFALGGVLIIIGLSLFLLGTEISIIPFGQLVGSSLVNKRNATLMVIAGFIVGIVITIAEPQVQILAGQVIQFNASISRLTLVVAIALGVGLFVAGSFLRILLNFSYRWTVIIGYSIIAIIAFFADSFYIPIAFDAGGATTGPMTVPFILALGIGVSNVRRSDKSEENSFGLVGIASIGPIVAVLLMAFLANSDPGNGVNEVANQGQGTALLLGPLFVSSFFEVIQAMSPLAFLFILFHFTLLHLQRRQIIRSIEGIIYTSIGLIIFLVGVNGALMPTGSALGSSLGSFNPSFILIPIGFVFGAVIVLAEPAVWVLTEQVREVSGGTISKKIVLVFFSLGVSIAVALAMVRIVYSIPLTYILIPGYTIALLLSFFSPPLYTAIAFDSGGVASGPLSSSFLLAFALGVSQTMGGNPFLDGFGIVALVAMTPLITIQILGVFIKQKTKKNKSQTPPKEAL